jgi:hypothetical protein
MPLLRERQALRSSAKQAALDARRRLTPSGPVRTVRAMAKPVEDWTPDELRTEVIRLLDELARRAAPIAAQKKGVDVVRACENWVRGRAWDETFTREMVEDEFAIFERKTGHELGALDRERLVQMWLALYNERHQAAA